jgi:tripartite motif-containing protein 71
MRRSFVRAVSPRHIAAAFTVVLVAAAFAAQSSPARTMSTMTGSAATTKIASKRYGYTASAALTSAVPANAHRLVLVWSSKGGSNPFGAPDGLAVDRRGNLYVADSSNNRIQKLDSQGHLITKWGSHGTKDGQLDCSKCGVAVGGDGSVYVTDNGRVQEFDGNGKFVRNWGKSGNGDGEFYSPFGVAADRQGNVYVGDPVNVRVQKFDRNGTFLVKFGKLGLEAGQFSGELADIAVDARGNIYVTDRGRGLQKFDRNGHFLAAWRACGDKRPVTSATGVALDSQSNVYFYDLANGRICKYSSNGHFLVAFGGFHGDVGMIAIDQQGDIYVAEVFANRVLKFRQT